MYIPIRFWYILSSFLLVFMMMGKGGLQDCISFILFAVTKTIVLG